MGKIPGALVFNDSSVGTFPAVYPARQMGGSHAKPVEVLRAAKGQEPASLNDFPVEAFAPSRAWWADSATCAKNASWRTKAKFAQ